MDSSEPRRCIVDGVESGAAVNRGVPELVVEFVEELLSSFSGHAQAVFDDAPFPGFGLG